MMHRLTSNTLTLCLLASALSKCLLPQLSAISSLFASVLSKSFPLSLNPQLAFAINFRFGRKLSYERQFKNVRF
uniref:Secreted protein n=1 Tax=Kalanchoe fedtschenkoi TaxID=63787 RepID=A0A7N0R9N5_KALFE